MAIYNTALTDDQMTEIYNGGKTFNHNDGSASGNLLAWYKFGTGIVDGIQDSTSVIFNTGFPIMLLYQLYYKFQFYLFLQYHPSLFYPFQQTRWHLA